MTEREESNELTTEPPGVPEAMPVDESQAPGAADNGEESKSSASPAGSRNSSRSPKEESVGDLVGARASESSTPLPEKNVGPSRESSSTPLVREETEEDYNKLSAEEKKKRDAEKVKRALSNFEIIKGNIYISGSKGRGGEESFPCECDYDPREFFHHGNFKNQD